jgi:undecaprenol kinase
MNSLFKAFGYALQGIRHCLFHERNFAIHCVLTMLVVTAGWIFKIDKVQWMIVLLNISLVLGFEMINTAVERCCNMIQPQHSPLVKIIKDVAAGAVLMVSIIAVICGLVIFIPKILSL